MPSITIDPEGDPSYPTEEPNSSPTNSKTSGSSTSTTSATSSCTSTTTGYDKYVTCTPATGSAARSNSMSRETSTLTTTGCDIRTTASTTTVPACPLSASASISSAYESARAAAGTVISGTTYPLAFWPTDSFVPGGFTISQFGNFSERPTSPNSTVATNTSSTRSTASTLSTSTTSSRPRPKTSSTKTPSMMIAITSTHTTSKTSSTKAPSASSQGPAHTTSPATTANDWALTAYSVDCDTLKKNADFSYYTLSGYDKQSPDETCIQLRWNLPTSSTTSNSCAWFEDGGFRGPEPCSSGTFGQPKSFIIKDGFCTIYKSADCTGVKNAVDSQKYTGCTSVKDGWVDLGGWGSMRCFAYPSKDPRKA
ncbi:hypothetical protein GGR52DRAFT_564393 [Hypoxylon sp. FL1284]|nr:hypothetical protein GGR52DRAFT_564393 [Hypoxylon sp. FL1284]